MTKRHRHAGSPRVKIKRQRVIVGANGNVYRPAHATSTHVYHPTKGWRKIGRDSQPGFAKLSGFLSRAFRR